MAVIVDTVVVAAEVTRSGECLRVLVSGELAAEVVALSSSSQVVHRIRKHLIEIRINERKRFVTVTMICHVHQRDQMKVTEVPGVLSQLIFIFIFA